MSQHENEMCECRECHKTFNYFDMFYDEMDTNYVCDSCYLLKNYSVCDRCGRIQSEINNVNVGYINEAYVCDSCLDYFDECSECGHIVSSNNIWDHDATNTGRTICNHCAVNFIVCTDCGQLVYASNSASNHGRSDLCSTCYDDDYDDDDDDDDDENYDDDDDEYDKIHSHDYKPSPRFMGQSAEDIYFGVELEVDYGNNRNSAAVALSRICNNQFYLKRDGSLENEGFEIVTHPASLIYHRDSFPWENIKRAVESQRYKSHDTTTCGLHVHVSRKFFGDGTSVNEANLAKLVTIVDNCWLDLVKFSRRNSSSLNQWAPKPNADINEDDCEMETRYKLRNSSAYTRYKSINITNKNTVEFRIFRGTLKRTTILACIELVDFLSRFAVYHSLSECYNSSWDSLSAAIHEDSTGNYDELKNYINNYQKKGLN